MERDLNPYVKKTIKQLKQRCLVQSIIGTGNLIFCGIVIAISIYYFYYDWNKTTYAFANSNNPSTTFVIQFATFKIGILIIMFFIIRMYLIFHKYNLRMRDFYRSRQDALEMYLNTNIELMDALEFFKQESIQIDNPTETGIQKILDLMKKVD